MNKETPPDVSTELAEYTKAVGARKWIIMVFMVTAGVTALLVSLWQTPVFQSSITIALSQRASQLFNTPTTINQFLVHRSFLENIITEADLPHSVAVLRRRVHAENISGSAQVLINVTDPQPQRAKKIADLIAVKFVSKIERTVGDVKINKTRRKRSRDISSAMKKFTKEIGEVKAELVKFNQQKSDGPETALYTLGLNQRLDDLEGNRIALQDQAFELNIILEKEMSTQIVSPASKPVSPIFPQTKRNVAVAGIAALIAGVGLAIAIKPIDKEV